MIVLKHAPVLSCYYNREKRCLDLHAGFFFYIRVLHGYNMRFLDGPIVQSYTYWSFLYARNIECILSKPTQLHYFFPHNIFFCAW